MSSILTNNSAMVALATLRTVNNDLSDTQNQISTGKKVGNAKDNAAVWATSAVMQSDVTGFKAITDTLSLGSSTLNVARTGSETVNKLLNEMKGRIISAQEENVDRVKINNDASELRSNIEATVEASQFNGLNLLKGKVGEASVDVLASLDRDAAGNVAVANIAVDRASLTTAKSTSTAATWEGSTPATVALTATNVATFGAAATDLTKSLYAEGDVIAMQLTNSAGQGVMLSYEVTAADLEAADDVADLATSVQTKWAEQLAAANTAKTFDSTGITIGAATNNVTLAIADTQTVDITYQTAQGGGLAALSLIDVSTKGGAAAALSAIEDLTQTSIEAAAAFGSSGKRVDIQKDFLKTLTDSFTSGIGSLVDADMEESSARLKALQTQQQLATQSLTIANQGPQAIMSLFR